MKSIFLDKVINEITIIFTDHYARGIYFKGRIEKLRHFENFYKLYTKNKKIKLLELRSDNRSIFFGTNNEQDLEFIKIYEKYYNLDEETFAYIIDYGIL